MPADPPEEDEEEEEKKEEEEDPEKEEQDNPDKQQWGMGDVVKAAINSNAVSSVAGDHTNCFMTTS